ncbi:MAG TPA: ABC transporter substrate-binding protein [Thiolinea sp.]|nr:ABC transporter substrate-binding protein [Thiolinea sp.]
MKLLQTTLLAAALCSTSTLSMAEEAALKIGLMLPATGTYAQLGTAIENGFKLYVNQVGGKLGGRDVEYVKLDDESDPAKATDNINKLIKSDKVDVVIGTVHSGVAAAMAKVAKQTGTLLVVPNAGSAMITGPMCAPNIFRSSFSNQQPGFAMGKVAAEKGYKKVATITWKYGAGEESVGGFKEAFEADGGEVVKELYVPFPNVEFQALLTEIAALKPDAVYSFFAGAGAVKFVKDYKAAGLMDNIPLLGAGFLTDGTLKAQGGDGEGLLTTLHYADELDNETDKAFRQAYNAAFDMVPDVYAVQGFDAAQILDIGLKATGGDVSKTAEIAAAVESTEIDSPRGKFTLSKAHNPIQDIYLREAKGEENVMIGVAVEKLDDPAKGCRL